MRYPIICQAIRNRRLIRIFYSGKTRTIEPHAYGHTHKGHEVLRAYQIAGGKVAWRLFRIDKVSQLFSLDSTFPTRRPGYERNDADMSNIICQL
jgi:predicted DNA-binding transcriptional regulator YafY